MEEEKEEEEEEEEEEEGVSSFKKQFASVMFTGTF